MFSPNSPWWERPPPGRSPAAPAACYVYKGMRAVVRVPDSNNTHRCGVWASQAGTGYTGHMPLVT